MIRTSTLDFTTTEPSSKMYLLKFLLPIMCIISVASSTPSPDAETRLLKDLANRTSDFHKNSPPTHDGPVLVTVSFELHSFNFKDETKGLTDIHGNVLSVWTDTRLAWNSKDYDGIEYVLLPLDNVWLPDINVVSSGSAERHYAHGADVSYSGNVTLYDSYSIESICRPNLRYFPYDKQVCSVSFGSTAHFADKVKLLPIPVDVRFFYNEEGGDFKITKFDAGGHKFAIEMWNWDNINFNIHMERISSAYSVKLILPAVVTGFVTLMTFLLPPSSHEKVILAGLTLVSLIQQLLNLQDIVPGSGRTMMGDFLAFAICIDFFAIVVAALSYYLHGKESKTDALESSKIDALPLPHGCQGMMKILRYLDIMCFVIFLIVYIVGIAAIFSQRE